MKGKCRGTLLTRNSAKNRQKTGTDAKVTECSSAGCWQKWPKKAKSAGFGRGNETFLAGEAIFFLCFNNFRGIAGPKVKKNHAESGAESVVVFALYLGNNLYSLIINIERLRPSLSLFISLSLAIRPSPRLSNSPSSSRSFHLCRRKRRRKRKT